MTAAGEDGVRRVAAWSGPRNVSTAMMRAFGNRADAVCVDEPFYGVFLAATGADHPMRAEILAAMPTRPADVLDRLFAPLPTGARIQYQKHMTHHMVPAIPRDWFAWVDHVFLVRRPEDVLASYADKRERVTLADVGFREQRDIFRAVLEATGRVPPVVDGRDVQAAPRATLEMLCAALAIPFDPAMLSWPPGRRPEDGVWAAHWYGAVEASTGFRPPRPPVGAEDLPEPLARIAEAARPLYEEVAAHALRP